MNRGELTPGTLPTYLFPINPGQPNMLTGTMGELRTTHFHGGLDINTPGIRVPVRATQQGYIKRVTISPFGYGNVVYVQHPDGFTSVYAHLHELKGALAKHVHEQHYQRKTCDLDLFFEEGKFPVQQGDTIALSGNTGSSGGPHLHFELRTAQDELVNPLAFGFREISDPLAPSIQKIALRTLTIDSRINDQFGRFEFYPVKTATGYKLPPILAHGKIGIEVLAFDKLDRSRFKCGINYIDVFENNEQVFAQHIEKFSLTETRGILTLLDYKVLESKGQRYNKLYLDDGNRLEFYQKSKHNGVIEVGDSDKEIRIAFRDQMNNKTEVDFILRPAKPTPLVQFLPAPAQPLAFEVDNQILVITSKACSESTLFSNGTSVSITPTYANPARSVYLVDLRTIRPDSLKNCWGSLAFRFRDRVPANVGYRYYSNLMDIDFPYQALYDTMLLETDYWRKDSLEYFSIGNRFVPLHRSINVNLKPQQNYVASGKWAVYRVEGNRFTPVGGEWKNGRVRFTTREFGVFTIRQDTQPPSVTAVKSVSHVKRFRIRDDLAGIAYYEANINGAWLLLSYDYKTGILETDRTRKDLKGLLEVKVVDNAGNETIIKQNL
jgi:hypothetical protein